MSHAVSGRVCAAWGLASASAACGVYTLPGIARGKTLFLRHASPLQLSDDELIEVFARVPCGRRFSRGQGGMAAECMKEPLMSDPPRTYPLHWPTGYPRTPSDKRREGRFSSRKRLITIRAATERLVTELKRLGAVLPCVSTNVEPRLDGLPRSARPSNGDPGVCVYFQLRGKSAALPCDRYSDTESNLAAITAHIDATRAITRHGVANLEQMFAGFMAIRGPGERTWQEILGIPPGRRSISTSSAAESLNWRSVTIRTSLVAAMSGWPKSMLRPHEP